MMYSRERANGVPTRFIDVSEHACIRQIALGVDVQNGRTSIAVHGCTAKGETVVLEHAVVETGSDIVHYGFGAHEYLGRQADEVEREAWQKAKAVEAVLMHLYRTDPAIRSRVREMIDARRKTA